jgi:hypothetical protein
MPNGPESEALYEAVLDIVQGKNNGRQYYARILTQVDVLGGGTRPVTRPVCPLMGDEYFELYTPVRKGASDRDVATVQLMQIARLNNHFGQYGEWIVIVFPGSTDILGISLNISYSESRLFTDKAWLRGLFDEFARQTCIGSDNDALPELCRELGLD